MKINYRLILKIVSLVSLGLSTVFPKAAINLGKYVTDYDANNVGFTTSTTYWSINWLQFAVFTLILSAFIKKK